MRSRGMFAVIPVKRFSAAKSRLSPFLTSSERVALARAMFQDVLTAARAATSLSGVLVVTADLDAASIAIGAGADVLTEHGQYGYTAAVTIAARQLKRRNVGGIVIIPIDIPQVTPALIDDVVARTSTPGVTIIGARSDGGTNMLAMRPCGIMPPKFGHDSFVKHTIAAREAGIEPAILTDTCASLDIDLPQDLLDFLALNTPTHTHRLLAVLNIAERKRNGTE